METTSILGNRAPRHVQSVPFASETGLQEFVEDNAEECLGVRVIASTRAGCGGLHRIDILATDEAGRPWIIECKHDLVDAAAVRQLRRYRDALVRGWAAVAPRFLQDNNSIQSEAPDPVLALIGYRFDGSVNDERIRCFVYKYHDISFIDDELQVQAPGRVSLQPTSGIAGPELAHPKVSKKIATSERLERFAPKLAEAFWQVDAALIRMGARVKYGGKNFVRYSVSGRVFAEAVISDGVVTWHTTASCSMNTAAETTAVIATLSAACGTQS